MGKKKPKIILNIEIEFDDHKTATEIVQKLTKYTIKSMSMKDAPEDDKDKSDYDVRNYS